MKKIISKSNKAVLVALGLGIGVLTPYTAMATNGYFSHGFGTKNKALAGGGIALPQDAMIAATNPAGIVFVDERMEAGVALFAPMRSYSASSATGGTDGAACAPNCAFTIGGASGGQALDSDNEQFLIPHFAYNMPLDDTSSFGVSVYGNGGMNTEYKGGTAQHQSSTGTYETTAGTFGAGTAGVNLEQLFINASYAGKIADEASWGVSAIYAYQRFKADGLSQFAGYSASPSNISNNGTDNSSGFGLKLGLQAEVAKGVTLAASYQTEMDMDKFDKYSGLFAEGGDFDIPATLILGAAWQTSERSTFTVDVQTIYYSDVPAIANPIANLTGQCTPGATGGTGAGCLGGANGAGFGWEDMTIVKLGYQWQTSPDWVWRAGYSKGDQPIPSSEVVFNILAPAVIEEHITFGFTHNMSKTSEFSFSAMYAPETTVSGANTFNPSQTVAIKMDQYELEASWGWKF